MLHRSFKPAKCKTALKLAVSRIKLLKNKKEAAYRQQKREVAQLLESGQDRTARIRVEHVVREEKTMAAYELIEIYCELIVARLSMIESQKNCPIDLKEAITSVIFASPRCADIPELLDIRKHFTAKYGKDFISSAVELRPNSGVNRMLVEKLSAVAPDIQTKIKILTTIAEEHNIKWDPLSLGDMDGKPTEDLLNGPKTFDHDNKVNVEPQVVQAHLRYEQKHDEPVNDSPHSALRSEHFTSTDVGTSKNAPASPHPENRTTGQSEEMERGHSFSREGNDFSLDKQNWNMEFKDATSAAQAAAEAAERASIAARAAAELSSHENTRSPYSKGSQNSSDYGLRDEDRQNHKESTLQSEDPARQRGNNSFHGANSRSHDEQVDRNEKVNPDRETEQLYSRSGKSNRLASLHEDILVKSPPKNDDYSQVSSSRVGSVKHGSRLHNEKDDRSEEDNPGSDTEQLYGRSRKSNRSAALKSSPASPHEDILIKSPPKNDDYSQMSSSRVGSVKRNNDDHFGEEFMKEQFNEKSQKQYDIKTGNFDSFGEERFEKQSSRASSHSRSSTFSNDHEKFENDIGRDLFSSVGQENILDDTKQAPSYDHADLVFDDYSSNNADRRFNTESSFFTSPGGKSQIHLSESTNILNPVSQSHIFTDPSDDSLGMTKSKLLSEPNDLSVKFDHSECPSSESEEELIKTKHGYSPTKHISPRLGKSQLDFDDINKYSFYNEFDEESSHQSSNLSAAYETKNNAQISKTSMDTDDGDFFKLPSFDKEKELNLGVLMGGLRNKPYKPPPYTARHQCSDDSSKPAVEEQSNKKLHTRDTNTSSDSESEDFIQGRGDQKEATKLQSKTRFENQSVQFDSDTSDLKVDLSQQNSPSKGRLASGGVSRRTRGGPSSYAKLKDSADGSVISVSDEEKTRSNERESSKPAQYKNKLHEERLKTSAFEKPRWNKQTSSKAEEELKNSFQEEKLKPSAFEKPRWDQQSSSKPAEEFKNSFNEEKLKVSSFEKPRWNEQPRPKPEQELKNSLPGERLKTSAFEKPISDEEEMKMPEERLKKSAFEKPRSGGEGFKMPEERLKKFAFDKPRYNEQDSPKPAEEFKNSFNEEKLKVSSFEKPRWNEQPRPKPEQELKNSLPGERLKTSAFEKPISDEDEMKMPEERLKTSALEKPRSGGEGFKMPEERLKKSAFEKPRYNEQDSPKPAHELKNSSQEERMKTSAFEKPSAPSTSKTENLKTSSSASAGKVPSRENSVKKASHVHPKLPDYDSITAHLQSLRSNQK